MQVWQLEPCPGDADLFLSLQSSMVTGTSNAVKATLYSKADGYTLEAKVQNV